MSTGVQFSLGILLDRSAGDRAFRRFPAVAWDAGVLMSMLHQHCPESYMRPFKVCEEHRHEVLETVRCGLEAQICS